MEKRRNVYFRRLIIRKIIDTLLFMVTCGIIRWNIIHRDEMPLHNRIFYVLFDPYDREPNLIFTVLNVPVILLGILFFVPVIFAIRKEKARLSELRSQTVEPIVCYKGQFPSYASPDATVVYSAVFLAALLGAGAYIVSLIADKTLRSIPFAADLGLVIATLLILKIKTHFNIQEHQFENPCRRCGCATVCLGGDVEVLETFYDTYVRELTHHEETTRTTTIRYTNGLFGRTAHRDRITENTKISSMVEVFENVKQERIRITSQCPCCLQTYQANETRLAESLEGKPSVIADNTSYKYNSYNA